MAEYSPPIEDLPIFDNLVFTNGDEPLTYNIAKKKFLRYPIAQGTETLQAITVNGVATFNNNIDANKPIVMTGTSSNDRVITNTYYNLNDVTTNVTDGSIYANNGVFIYDNNINSGSHEWAVNNSSGTQTLPLTISSNFVKVNTTSSSPLRVSDNGDGTKYAEIYQNGGGLTLHNQVNNGSVGFTLKNSGGTSSSVLNLTTSLVSVNSTDLTLTTTNPPTSTATQPASSDSSTKMPTTAWVQSAISASIPTTQFVPKFYNYSDTQSGVSIGYSTGTTINFNGTWAQNDIAIFRVTGQISYNPDGSGAYQSTSNTMGVVLFRPYYMTSGWAGWTTNLCNYTSNTPSTVCGADRHIMYYTPSYNIGNTSYFNVAGGIGTAQFGCLSQGNPSTWTYLFSIEYLMSRTANGTITFTNGSGTNSINNQLK